MTRTDQEPARPTECGGLTVQRFAQLVEQRRYEIHIGADGLEALLAPYGAPSSAPTVPGQRRPAAER